MATYSRLDLIGETINGPSQKAQSILKNIYQRIFAYKRYYYLDISVPKMIYLRSINYCEALSTKSGLTFQIEHLVDVIYKFFIQEYYRQNNTLEFFKLITHYQDNLASKSPTVVVNHLNNETYDLEANNQSKERQTFHYRINRKAALKGEILLAEIDAIHGSSTTLEQFIEIVWCQYINRSKKMSEQKTIRELKSILNLLYG